MGERNISCLNERVMTIFIFSIREGFCQARYYIGPWILGLLASALVGGGVVPARAARFPFPTNAAADHAQGDTLYQQAFAAYQSGDYAQALGLIEKADKLKPDQPDGWNLRGMVYLKQDDFKKAEAAFSRAVVLDPKLWAAQFNLAEAPFQGKDYARARTRFDKLLDQTDRFKEAKKWELVQFKAFLSTLLMGDAIGAARRLEKLPAKGGVTPAYLYAQAATSFSRRDAAGARRSLVAAQSAYAPLLNDLFSNSLAEVGWMSAPAPPPMSLPPGQPPRGPSTSSPPPELASSTAPLSPLPADAPRFADKYAPIVIDPKLEAGAAEPLPTGDTGAHPVLPKVTPMASMMRPASKAVPDRALPPQAPVPPPVEIASEHRGLLLDE